MTKRSQTSLHSLGGWQCSGLGHQDRLLMHWGALVPPLEFVPQSTKAVSGVRDCPQSTGCSDLKNTPGLLEDGAGTHADICGSS